MKTTEIREILASRHTGYHMTRNVLQRGSLDRKVGLGRIQGVRDACNEKLTH